MQASGSAGILPAVFIAFKILLSTRICGQDARAPLASEHEII